jgi:hypothetical protein
MILVRGIGISGYVPLEGVVGLSHALLRYRSNKCESDYDYSFEYLGVRGNDKTNNLGILRRVVSFAVVRYFDDHIRSILIRDVDLFFGYYCAGVVFSNRLRDVFRNLMFLSEYCNLARFSYHPNYPSTEFVYTSAWYEYIDLEPDFPVCLKPDASYVYSPSILIRILEYKNPFPAFLCNELRHVLSR